MTIPSGGAGRSTAERTEGFLIGAAVGAALMASPAPFPGSRHAATALADGLMEELLSGGVDLHRLAGRWLAWWEHDGLGADPGLAQALTHLRDYDAPILPPFVPGIAPMAAVLPAALTSASPQGMVVGAFHVAGLLDPNDASGLAAVAVVVTAASFLEGHRDFIADVIGVLRANSAPAELLDGVRGIPRDPSRSPPIPYGESPDPTATLIWLLWTVHHRPRGVEMLRELSLRGNISPMIGAVLGGLMGARDGIEAWPEEWLERAGEDVVLRRGVARRLTMMDES